MNHRIQLFTAMVTVGLLQACGDPATIDGTYQVTIDYSKSLEQMLTEANFTGVDENITSDTFPVDGEGTEEVEVVTADFESWVTTDDVESGFKDMHIDFSTIFHLLAVAAAYPDAQRGHFIVGLGSSWTNPDGKIHYPVLVGDDERRELILVWDKPGDGWLEGNQFAGTYGWTVCGGGCSLR